MRTSDDRIWAVGDAIVTQDWVTKADGNVPLAGPANRQGRVAADSIFGRGGCFRGVQGTAVCGAFGMVIASTGASEKALKRAGITDYQVREIHSCWLNSTAQHAHFSLTLCQSHLVPTQFLLWARACMNKVGSLADR